MSQAPTRPKIPRPASREEQVSHFYARHAALDRGERLSWSDERRHPWPKKDRINWIGHRQAELETEISKCRKEREKKSLEQTREDYNTWMLKERDGQSWSKIAQSRIEQMGIPKQQSYGVSEAFKAQARRAWTAWNEAIPEAVFTSQCHSTLRIPALTAAIPGSENKFGPGHGQEPCAAVRPSA